MNIKLFALSFVCLPLILSGALAQAEIYKWKDSDGRIRYSDVPPPSNVPQETLRGKKVPKAISDPQAPLSQVNGNITDAIERQNKTANKAGDATKRAEDAEAQKKADEAKEAEIKLKEENCRVAKSNLQIFSDGGRIIRPNKLGEREFLGDKDIAAGLADAQKDVDKYCN
jgi:hypothetical protein